MSYLKNGKFRSSRASVSRPTAGVIRLTSYCSAVCDVNDYTSTITIYPDSFYGNTTGCHVTKFLHTLGIECFIAKRREAIKHDVKVAGYTLRYLPIVLRYNGVMK